MFKQREKESSRLLFAWHGGDLFAQKSSWIYIYEETGRKSKIIYFSLIYIFQIKTTTS
uniref:hypothetical protein n=1 Tax=Bacillus cytotoxicus TaxID=580165 RepID=UPI00203DA02E